MDVESLIQRNPSLKKKYITVSAEERSRMVQSFKGDLMQSRIENDIVAVPESFQLKEALLLLNGLSIRISAKRNATLTRYGSVKESGRFTIILL